MNYKISWLLENRIILITYHGAITKADLQAYLLESAEMRDRANVALGEGGPLVHTITDARGMTANELSLKEALKAIETLRSQRVGWSVYIPFGKTDQFFAVVGHQVAGVRFRCVASVAEAASLLKKMDDTLREFAYTDETAPLAIEA